MGAEQEGAMRLMGGYLMAIAIAVMLSPLFSTLVLAGDPVLGKGQGLP